MLKIISINKWGSKMWKAKELESIKKKTIFKKSILLTLLTVIIGSGFFSSMPLGTSYEGELQDISYIEFLYDLSYKKDNKTVREHKIFDEIIKMIKKAEEFIIIDIFLFNDDYDRKNEFPPLSSEFTNALIEQKEKYPDLKIFLITDEINNFYGAYESKYLKKLRENNIEVIITDINKMRNSNPLYSGIWKILLKWMGTSGEGWIRNPFSPDSPKVNIRSYLKLANFKANHRKVFITENAAIVSSANIHDASGYHSNIAFKIKGEIINDLIKSEMAVAEFSGFNMENIQYRDNKEVLKDVKAMVITEGKIKKHILEEIKSTDKNDKITMGMFYLSDRDVIKELIEASQRGVEIKIILDANKDAFGLEKNGIPNRSVAWELVKKSKGNIDIKWYATHGEQYHTKLILIERNDNTASIIGGSANFTVRNIGDYNIETNLKIVAKNYSEITQDIRGYFDRIWENKDGEYTLDFSAYEENNFFKYIMYRFQEWSGLSTF